MSLLTLVSLESIALSIQMQAVQLIAAGLDGFLTKPTLPADAAGGDCTRHCQGAGVNATQGPADTAAPGLLLRPGLNLYTIDWPTNDMLSILDFSLHSPPEF